MNSKVHALSRFSPPLRSVGMTRREVNGRRGRWKKGKWEEREGGRKGRWKEREGGYYNQKPR